MNWEVVVGLFQVPREQCLASEFKINHIGHTDIDNTEKSLVAFLKFFLVEDLNCYNGSIVDRYIERVIPVRVQCFLDDRSGVGLLTIYCYNSERIGQAKYIPLYG